MAKVIFGVYDGKVIDNRNKKIYEIGEHPEFQSFDEFNPGNPIKAFIGAHGFFIFEKDVDLLDAARQHMERVAEESCGKCTPCRVGTQIISTLLQSLADGDGAPELLDEIEAIAKHVRSTSLCGLGQTSTVALLGMLTHYRRELLALSGDGGCQRRQPVTGYVTTPCIEACPSRVDVPRYIDYIKDGKLTHSAGVILQKYPMAATCGRVCVRFCEMACRRTQVDEAVGIKVLKRFVADHQEDVVDEWFSRDLIGERKPADLKVAVIGTGPAGTSAAYHLLLKGYPVDIYEAISEPGGMAATGIPNYRLPKKVLRREIGILESLGGRIHYNSRLGVNIRLNDLLAQGYQAVFLGVGAHKGKTLGVDGEDQAREGYEFGVKFLLHVNHDYINNGAPMNLGRKMVVVGGGNVAMDCARSALRLGVDEVHLVYRRSREEMPADHEEVEAAEKEGVIFHFLTHPRRLMSEDGRVTALQLIRMKLGPTDESGRRGVVPIEGSDFVLETDYVIPAIGQQVDRAFVESDDGVAFNNQGLIEVHRHTLMTSRRGVFAGGDCVTGPATVVQAMAQGYRAAQSIDDYLTYGRVRFSPEVRFSELLASTEMLSQESVPLPTRHQYRVTIQELDPEVRKRMFEEVEKPISLEEAYREANRCMRCYRVYSVVTEQ